MIGQYIDCLRIRHLLVIYTCISKYLKKKNISLRLEAICIRHDIA
jgi:hypothetical protein